MITSVKEVPRNLSLKFGQNQVSCFFVVVVVIVVLVVVVVMVNVVVEALLVVTNHIIFNCGQ